MAGSAAPPLHTEAPADGTQVRDQVLSEDHSNEQSGHVPTCLPGCEHAWRRLVCFVSWRPTYSYTLTREWKRPYSSWHTVNVILWNSLIVGYKIEIHFLLKSYLYLHDLNVKQIRWCTYTSFCNFFLAPPTCTWAWRFFDDFRSGVDLIISEVFSQRTSKHSPLSIALSVTLSFPMSPILSSHATMP